MSKQTFEREVQKELDKLNRRIDQKIIKGLSYVVESHRHKQLLSKLASIRRQVMDVRAPDQVRKFVKRSWFDRSFSFLSAFIF